MLDDDVEEAVAAQLSGDLLSDGTVADDDDMVFETGRLRDELHLGLFEKAVGDRPDVAQYERGKDHREYDRDDQDLIDLLVDQRILARQCKDRQRELTHLKERECTLEIGAVLQERGEDGKLDRRLEEHDPRQQQEDDHALREDDREVDLHADRNEKDPQQDIAKGYEIGFDAVFVLGFGDRHPRQKGTQRVGKAEEMGDIGGKHDDQKHRDEKDLFGVGVDDPVQKALDEDAPEDEENQKDDHRAARGFEQQRREGDTLGGEDRQHQEDRDDRQILKEEDPQRHTPVTAVNGGVFIENLEDDRRRRECQRKTDDDGGFAVHAEEKVGYPREDRPRDTYLQRTVEKDFTLHVEQQRHRKLQPDREHQKDDSKLRQCMQLMDVDVLQAEDIADRHPRKDIPDDRRYLETLEKDVDDRRDKDGGDKDYECPLHDFSILFVYNF